MAVSPSSETNDCCCLWSELHRSYAATGFSTQNNNSNPQRPTGGSVSFNVSSPQGAPGEVAQVPNITMDRQVGKDVIAYADVSPTYTAYASGLVVKVMNELETRLPTLANLRIGKEWTDQNLASRLNTMVMNCREPGDISDYRVKAEDSQALCSLLKAFLQHLEYRPFYASITLMEMALEQQQSHPTVASWAYHQPNCVEVVDCIEFCCRALNRHQQATLAYMMTKMHMWIRKEIAFRLYFQGNRSAAEQHDWPTIFAESLHILALMFGPCMIGFSRNRAFTDKMNAAQLVEFHVTLFKMLLGLPKYQFWHYQLLTAMSDDGKLQEKK